MVDGVRHGHDVAFGVADEHMRRVGPLLLVVDEILLVAQRDLVDGLVHVDLLGHFLGELLGQERRGELVEARIGAEAVAVVDGDLQNLSEDVDVILAVVPHGLEVIVLEHVERLDQNGALAVGRRAVHVDAAVVGGDGRGLLGVELVEVLDGEIAAVFVVPLDDLFGDRAAIEIVIGRLEAVGKRLALGRLGRHLAHRLHQIGIVLVHVDVAGFQRFAVGEEHRLGLIVHGAGVLLDHVGQEIVDDNAVLGHVNHGSEDVLQGHRAVLGKERHPARPLAGDVHGENALGGDLGVSLELLLGLVGGPAGAVEAENLLVLGGIADQLQVAAEDMAHHDLAVALSRGHGQRRVERGAAGLQNLHAGQCRGGTARMGDGAAADRGTSLLVHQIRARAAGQNAQAKRNRCQNLLVHRTSSS